MKNKILPKGLYGITAEEFSNGRSNVDIVKAMINGGIKIIQYREKENKSIRQKYEECRAIRKITKDNGVLFLINDHPDIAMLVDADGIHIGQDDLPVAEARKLIGNKIIGVSTHSPEQAKKAQEDGSDYIGVGPIYKTYTKKNVCDPVGIGYLEYVINNIDIPFVAIGGIKEHNIQEIISMGANTIALVTEIVSAHDVAEISRRLQNQIINGTD